MAIPASLFRAQLEAIAKKISEGYTDTEIMNDLKVKRATFYNYKRKIFNQYGDLAAKKTEQSLEFEAEILKDRYIRLYRALEQRIITKAADDESLADIALAAEVATFISTNIFKLETEGLRARQGRPLQFIEEKALRYIRTLPAAISEPDFTPTQEDDEQVEDPNEQQTTGRTEEKVF